MYHSSGLVDGGAICHLQPRKIHPLGARLSKVQLRNAQVDVRGTGETNDTKYCSRCSELVPKLCWSVHFQQCSVTVGNKLSCQV